MRVYKGLENLPAFTNPIITIGSFDGVHLGHRKIINQIITKAKEVNGNSIIITFNPHPRLVLSNDTQRVSLLHTLDEKVQALEKLGVDAVVVVPFTKSFSEISAIDYIEDFLVKNFKPHTLVIGYDHRFGKDRVGNFEMLTSYKQKHQFQLEEIPAQEIESIAISSTKIRQALLEGNINVANQYLCNNYSLFGKVVHGEKNGRILGYPTANIQVHDFDKLIPANGVYVVEAWVQGKKYKGMMNIGIRPTISNNTFVSIEVHLLHFNEDIYGQFITVELVDKIRNEIKFNSFEELKTQLKNDYEFTLNYSL